MKLTKESRQRATAAMTKCDCGNVARLGQTQCGRCEDETDEANSIMLDLYNCDTVADLRNFISEHLLSK